MTNGKIELRSRRFGNLVVPAEEVLEFADGLVGLPRCRRFVIMDHHEGSPFKWMVSLDDPDLGFAVVDPCDFVPGYRRSIEEEVARLGGIGEGEVALLTIVTIPPDPARMTIDLMAPVVVNLRTRQAKQVVLESSSYPVDCPLVSLVAATG